MGASDSEDLALGAGQEVANTLQVPLDRSAHVGPRAEIAVAGTGAGSALARSVAVPACDLLALVIAGLFTGTGWLLRVGYGAAVLLALAIAGSDRWRICLRLSDEIPRVAIAALLPVLLFIPWVTPAVSVLRLGVASVILLVAGRAAMYAGLRAAHKAGRLTETALIAGTSELGRELGQMLLDHPDLGLRPVGFVGAAFPDLESPLPFLGDLSGTRDLVRRYRIRRLIVCCPEDKEGELVETVRNQVPASVSVYVVPRMHELAQAVPACYLDEVWGIPLAPLRHSGMRWPGKLAKRSFDLVLGTALLAVSGPVLMALIVTELVSVGTPVLFRQDRVTYAGHIRKIMKFRTMRTSPDSDSEWTADTEKCSAVGRWLRATHLDELPQLLNVLRGDMSLVGPRPERPFFTARFSRVIPHYEDRHRARTGLTGWAQVHGLTGDTSIPERVRFDNYYIEHWSLWLDVAILVRTLVEPMAGAVRAARSRVRTPRSRR